MRADNGASIIGGQRLALSLRRTGTTAERQIGTRTTAANSLAIRSDRPSVDGRYIVRFAGSTRYVRSTGSLGVDVR